MRGTRTVGVSMTTSREKGALVTVALCVRTLSSFASGVTIEDHGASFRALTEALAAEAAARAPSVRLGPSQPSGAELVVWTIGLFGLGALAMLAWSLLAGAWALGLALAARLAFVAILALAVLPWLARRGE